MATDSIVRQDSSGFVSATAPTTVDQFTGKLTLPAATVKAAVNKVCGTAALDSSGTVTISTTAVTATSLIFVMRVLDGGTVGGLYTAKAADITAGVSFIIRSWVSSTAGAATAASSDTSTVAWFLIN
jgi:hypothetical protein